MSTLVHRPFASSLRTHNENTKIFSRRQMSSLSIVLSGSRNSRESSNRSRLDVPCFVRMRSSSLTSASYLSSPVYSERYFSLQKSSCLRSAVNCVKAHGRTRLDVFRQPIPVCLKRKDLKGELERAIFSTYMHQNRGTCTCAPQCILIYLRN